MKRPVIKSDFTKNVLTLMTGTSIAQAIPIAISPILTRLYTPEDFGVFALYVSIVAILATGVSGRYNLAIVLPEKEKEAKDLLFLAFLINIIVSIILLFIAIVFNGKLTELLNNPNISSWLYLIPVSVFISGCYQCYYQWNVRYKEYRSITHSKVFQSLSNSAISIGLRLADPKILGLIIGQLVSQVFAIVILIVKHPKTLGAIKYHPSVESLLKVLKRYKNFPKFDLWASLMSISAYHITQILFNSNYSPIVAGYFYLAQRIVGSPITIISSAISDTFKQEASIEYRLYNNAKKTFLKTFYILVSVAFIPSILLYIWIDELFSLVFGKQWSVTSNFIKLMLPMLFFKFISSPLSFMLYIGERQDINLIGQFLFISTTVVVFWMTSNPYDVVLYLTICYSFIYILYLIISAKIAGVL